MNTDTRILSHTEAAAPEEQDDDELFSQLAGNAHNSVHPSELVTAQQ